MPLNNLRFTLCPSKVKVLSSPKDFYETLISMYQNVRTRAVISSLYIGTGSYTSKVIQTLTSTLNTLPQGQLKVDILMDKLRGSRQEGKSHESNSISQVAPLLKFSDGNVRISLFHNPLLNWWLNSILPERINELVGVMHIKAFISDNTMLISGANLNDSYLVDRQDRYILIEDMALCNAIHRIINCLQEFSYTLNLDSTLSWVGDTPDPLKNAPLFKQCLHRELRDTLSEIRKGLTIRDDTLPTNYDTQTTSDVQSRFCTIELCLQAGFTDPPIMDEVDLICKIFEKANQHSQPIVIASGYLNLPELYLQHLKYKQQHQHNQNLTYYNHNSQLFLITAAPGANSFFQSKGASYYIPAAYACVAQRSLDKICEGNNQHNLNLYEYCRENWTFHSKGIWIYPKDTHINLKLNSDEPNNEKSNNGMNLIFPNKILPIATVVGSSNYGERAIWRDLELSYFIQTNDKELQASIHTEVATLIPSCHLIHAGELKNRYSLWLKYIVDYFGKWFL